MRLLFVILLGSLAVASTTQAQQTAEQQPQAEAEAQQRARALFEHGVDLTARHRLTEAVDAFRASADLVPRASTLYNLGLSLFRLGRYRECLQAMSELEPLLNSESADERMRARVATLAERAAEQLASLSLQVSPANAQISIDGQPVAGSGDFRQLQLDPGRHRLRVTAEDHKEQTRELQLGAGETAQLHVALERQPRPTTVPPPLVPATSTAPPPAPPSRVGPYALLIGGGALLTAGAVTGILAKREDDAFERDCGGGFDNCSPQLQDKGSTVTRLAVATDVLLGLGLATGAAGALWWLLTDDDADDDADPDDASVQLGLRPGGVALHGQF